MFTNYTQDTTIITVHGKDLRMVYVNQSSNLEIIDQVNLVFEQTIFSKISIIIILPHPYQASL